ncbi:hypothetical protein [Thalassoglobus polymorphus]|uniref:Uncharacterized protein n=1 Tax=Thalassoglobus polymorphus TaxID=2527994 RepID=A0A517QU17_9PLAN|nr:hypothetical protein [Thalassoglobus polymorphus]QDT35135.1 hypothetical protein Mal48_44100 [Thalassoglobus polymorphus]
MLEESSSVGDPVLPRGEQRAKLHSRSSRAPKASKMLEETPSVGDPVLPRGEQRA